MGKSSLGKRKTSMMPVRMSSLGNVEVLQPGNTQRGRSSVKQSHIPKPRNSTRSSSSDKDAGRLLPSATSLRRSRSNSNLQHLGMATPITPMFFGGIPGTAQSVRSTLQDARGYSRAAKVLKDPRPLTDKQFQNTALQTIQNYFQQIDNTEFLLDTCKALRTKNLTLKLFVEMVSHLLSHFFKNYVINMSNYADEIPHLAKRLGYPGSVKKSWLITANSPHSWSNVVGLLSWLVHVVRSERREQIDSIMFPPEDDGDGNIPDSILDTKTMCSYYFRCHDLFNKDASESDRVAEDNRLIQEMVNKLNVNDRDFIFLRNEIEKLKTQLEDPEEEAAQCKMRKMEADAARCQSDLKKLQDIVEKKKANGNEILEDTRKVVSEQNMLKAHIEKQRIDISKLSQLVDNQSINLEDKKRIDGECRELEQAVRMHQAGCDALSKTVYADDLKIAKIKNELSSKCIEYNTSLLEYTNDLPELKFFELPMNFLHKDSDRSMQEIVDEMERFRTELKVKLNEMETLSEEKAESAAEAGEHMFIATEECKKGTEVLEELRTGVISMKEKQKQEEGKLKCFLKQLKEDCNLLVTNMPSLEEAEGKLIHSNEKVEYIKAHMLKMNEHAKKFFAEFDAIYEDLVQKLTVEMSSLLK